MGRVSLLAAILALSGCSKPTPAAGCPGGSSCAAKTGSSSGGSTGGTTGATTGSTTGSQSCFNTCASGAMRCSTSDASAYQVCAEAANGCTAWNDPTACTTPYVCDSNKATAATDPPCGCASTCVAGAERCSPTTDNPETCESDPTGCGVWHQQIACSDPARACGTLGFSSEVACQCKSAVNGCNNYFDIGSTLCPNGATNTYQVCERDAVSGCMTVSEIRTCPSAQQTCVAFDANANQACSCPAPPSCTPSCADGTHLQTCELDAAGGCLVQTSVDCGAAGQTCSTAGGAHCTCAAHAVNAIAVDASSGDDSSGSGDDTLFPCTGIAAGCAVCAYKSLTHGIAMASSGTTLTAGPGRYSSSTTGDFAATAIVLKDGVVVTTKTAPSLASPYIIFNDTSFIDDVVTYAGSGSTELDNFTLAHTAGGLFGAGDGFRCNSGAATLEGVTVASANYGIYVTGTCAATLNNVSALGNMQGIVIDSSGAQTLDTVVSQFNGNSFIASNGSVTASNLDVGFSYSFAMAIGAGDGNFSFAADGLSVHDAGYSGFDTAAEGLIVETHSAGLAANISLHNATFANNTGIGVRLNDESVTLTDSTAAGNGDAGFSSDVDGTDVGHTTTLLHADAHDNCLHRSDCGGIQIVSGAMSIAANGVGASTTHDNFANGILAQTLSNTAATALIQSYNHGNGALIDLAGGSFACDDCVASGNALNGYQVRGAPTLPAGAAFSLTASGSHASITGNGTLDTTPSGLFGVLLDGETAAVDARIDNIFVSAQTRGAGIAILDGVNGHAVAAALSGNDISQNGGTVILNNPLGGTVSLNAGGILLFTSGTSFAMQGNKVHANTFDGVAILHDPTAAPISVDLSAASCDATSNAFYCYGAGNVGVVAYDNGISVNAENASWQNAPPSLASDLLGASLFTTTEATIAAPTTYCTPALVCP